LRLFERVDGRLQARNANGKIGPLVTQCPDSRRGKPKQQCRAKGKFGKKAGNDSKAHNSNRRKARTDSLQDAKAGDNQAQFAFRYCADAQMEAQAAYDTACSEFGKFSPEAMQAFGKLVTAGDSLAKARAKFMATCK